MARCVTLLASLLLLTIITACGWPTVTGVVSLQILGGDHSLTITSTELLTPSVTAGSGVAVSVSWSSSDEDVATIDVGGVATALGLGTTTITATSTADATKSGSVVITVVQPTAADSAITELHLNPLGP